MHALYLHKHNLPVALKKATDTKNKDLAETIQSLTEHKIGFYLVTGYVNPQGMIIPIVILPRYIVETNFEIDVEKAQTDWDQIVRIE